MANTIPVDANILKIILEKLDKLNADIEQVKKKLIEEEPAYGSDAWWEWSDKKALEDIKVGRYKEFSSADELQAYLDSLKKS